jgi:hypothetical protein
MFSPMGFVKSASKFCEFLQVTADTVNGTTFTFSAQNLGAAAADRYIHVAVFGREGSPPNPTQLSSVTVGGVTATINIQQTDGDRETVAIVTAAVPTGTTGNIVVTWAESHDNCEVAVYRSLGLITAVAIDTDSSTADPGTATLTALAGGFCIGAATQRAVGSATWSGGVAEDYDAAAEANYFYTGAHGATGGASISPSCDYADTDSLRRAVFATF